MRRSRTAVAAALCLASLATAGCGFGPGEGVGEVSLTVTRDHGAEALVGPLREEVSESDNVMRVLEREADISTSYGGGFVDSIEGISEAVLDGRRHDWFFYVNGLWSPVGATEYSLRGGERIWWDYRDWSASNSVSAVVGSWPQPFAGGYEGSRHPTAVECRAAGVACEEARRRLREAGADLAPAGAEGAIRVLVGPWARLRRDSEAAVLEDGPAASGVYARFSRGGAGFELVGLDEGGDAARELGPGAGLVAAIRLYGGPPVWLVTGTDASGALAAARSLDAADLRDRYAVAVDDGEVAPLPVR